MFVAIDDIDKRAGNPSERIDGIEFAGFDERGDGRPVNSPGIVSGEECILAIESYRPDGPLDNVVVDLGASVGQEERLAIPVFGDVGQCLAKRGLRCDACAVMDEPAMQVCDEWR